MSVGTDIRRARARDFRDVLALLRQLWPGKRLNRDALLRVYSRGLRSSTQVFLAAVNQGRVIGFCSLTIKNNLWQAGYLGHVDELVVDSGHRGSGIGAALLQRITMIARSAGCRCLELDSAFHRRKAHAFYVQRGYVNRAYLFSKRL